MPIYEYRCKACGEEFSRLFLSIRAAEKEKPICLTCGSEELVRLISTVAIHTSSSEPSEASEKQEEEPRRKLYGRKELERAEREQGY